MDLDSFYLGYGEMMKKAFDLSKPWPNPIKDYITKQLPTSTYNPTQEAIKNVYGSKDVLNNELTKATNATGGISLNRYDNKAIPVIKNLSGMSSPRFQVHMSIPGVGASGAIGEEIHLTDPKEKNWGWLEGIEPEKHNIFKKEIPEYSTNSNSLLHEGMHYTHPEAIYPTWLPSKERLNISPKLLFPIGGNGHDQLTVEQDVYNSALQQHLFKTRGSRLETPEQAKAYYENLFKLPTEQLEQQLQDYPIDAKRGIRQLYKMNNFLFPTGPQKDLDSDSMGYNLNQQLEKLYRRIPGLVQNTQNNQYPA